MVTQSGDTSTCKTFLILPQISEFEKHIDLISEMCSIAVVYGQTKGIRYLLPDHNLVMCRLHPHSLDLAVQYVRRKVFGSLLESDTYIDTRLPALG